MNPYLQAEQLIYDISGNAIKTWQHCEAYTQSGGETENYIAKENLNKSLETLNQIGISIKSLEKIINTYPDLFEKAYLHEIFEALLNFRECVYVFFQSKVNNNKHTNNLLKQLNNFIRSLNKLEWEIYNSQKR